MSNVSLDNLDASASNDPNSEAIGSVPLGDNSTQEIARLQAECQRLTVLVKELEKDRDAYEQALYHYMAKEITREEVEASTSMEEGVPFEVILQDMEQILKDHEASNKQ